MNLRLLCTQGYPFRNWYREAHTQICVAAPVLERTPEDLASLLALFSPRVSVRKSILITLRYLESNTTPGVLRGVQASLRHYLLTGNLRGPKTSAFRNCLLGCESSCVLDVWMARALGLDQRDFSRHSVRIRARNRIYRVSRLCGLTIAQTQASIWAATLRSHGRNPHQFPLLSILDSRPSLFLSERNSPCPST